MTWRHAHARHARLTARRHHAHHGRSRHRSSTRRHARHARLSTRTLGHVHRPEHELLRRHARAGARNHLLLLSILTAPVRSWLRHTLSSLRRRRRHDALPSLLYSRDASSRTIAVPVKKRVSFVSHPVPRFHDLRSVPPPARDSTRLARSHASRARDPLLVRPRTRRRSPLADAIFPLTISHPSHASPSPDLRTAARLRRTIAFLVALASPSRVASSRAPVVVAIDPSRTTRRRSRPSRGFGPPLSTSRCVLAERARGSRTSGFGVALAIAARAVVLRTRARAVARSS